MSFKPDAGTKSPVVCELMEPSRNKPFDVRGRPHSIRKPGVPLPPIFPAGINECEKLVAVLTFNQAQFGLFINFVEKRSSPREFCETESPFHAKCLLRHRPPYTYPLAKHKQMAAVKGWGSVCHAKALSLPGYEN